jgi:hypothetical protein
MIGTHGDPERNRRFHWSQTVIVVIGAVLIAVPCAYAQEREANEMSRRIEQKKHAVKQADALLKQAPALTRALERAAAKQRKLAEKARRRSHSLQECIPSYKTGSFPVIVLITRRRRIWVITNQTTATANMKRTAISNS